MIVLNKHYFNLLNILNQKYIKIYTKLYDQINNL
jgi:hypothetical protein